MKICGAYEIVEQEDINNVLDNVKNNNVINLEVLEKEKIAKTTSDEGIMFNDINDIRLSLYLRHKRNIKIKNCDFNEREHIIIETPIECVYLEDSTLPKVRFRNCNGFRINVSNTYISRLNISSCILDILLIENSIVDEIVISSSIIRNGLLVNYNSTIRRIVLVDSLVNNTQAVIDNTIANRQEELSEVYDLYEDVLEDVATESFRMTNSCIINNNTVNTNAVTEDLKEALNDSEYIRKRGAMICGIYERTNNKKGE